MNAKNECLIRIVDRAESAEAAELSKKTGIPFSDTLSDGLNVIFDENGVLLSGFGLSYKGDFSSLLKRVTNGKLNHEMLVHAAKTKAPNPTAIDATAGMGEDSFLLAAYGYDVIMFEQNPVIACLLSDSLKRASADPDTEHIIKRMHLIEGSSIDLMNSYAHNPDMIYLDPMFPERHKSGLIGKKLQLLQKLEQPCVDENALLDAAIAVNPKKIIIKRPLKGGYLANRKPSYTNEGKAIRYDCFVFPENL